MHGSISITFKLNIYKLIIRLFSTLFISYKLVCIIYNERVCSSHKTDLFYQKWYMIDLINTTLGGRNLKCTFDPIDQTESNIS